MIVQAPLNNLGYGVASRNILKELVKFEDIYYFPIGKQSLLPEDTQLSEKLINGPHSLHNRKDATLKIWHQNDLHSRIGCGLYMAMPFFELDTFNDVELSSLSMPDVILVTSEWAKQVVIDHASKINPLHVHVEVVPLGVDADIFTPKTSFDDNKCIFLNIGKWEIRKGHDVLIEMFQRAFQKDEPVELWMMPTNPFINGNQVKEWTNMYSDNRVKILPTVESHKDVAALIAQTTCGIFPSRAEGWNLSILEMMAMGRRVILTNYSAHTEYANKDNSLLIDVTDKEDAVDGIWFHGQGKWAKIDEPQIEQAVSHLRTVFDAWNSTERQNKLFNSAGIETAKFFSWHNTAKRIVEISN